MRWTAAVWSAFSISDSARCFALGKPSGPGVSCTGGGVLACSPAAMAATTNDSDKAPTIKAVLPIFNPLHRTNRADARKLSRKREPRNEHEFPTRSGGSRAWGLMQLILLVV